MPGTRAEHLAWCKTRALQYVDAGDLQQAFASIGSDIEKHDETRGHTGVRLGFVELMDGGLETPEKMRAWIEGLQ